MSKNITATYSVGDRVAVTLPQTSEQPAPATIEKAANGWFVCRLDRPDLFPLAKGGIVSARKDRMTLLPVGAHGDAEQPAPAAKQSAAPIPVDCPECDCDELEHETLANGKTRFTCPECDWSGDYDATTGLIEDASDNDDVEEALDEAEEHASKMAEALRKARQRYVKTTRPNGAATAHNGDVIAKELRDYEPEDVCKLADRIFALPIGTHLAKYDHLNNGQKRMNAGNRIRGAWRKQEDKEVCDRIANLLGLNDQEDDEEQLASLEDRGPESLADLQPVEQA